MPAATPSVALFAPVVSAGRAARNKTDRRAPPTADEPELKALLAPYPADDMICWPVSARVVNVRNNDSSLIEPVAAA